MRKYGFTLIELLIVVAIIAILAAIAVPNFLEAQTRAKVSRSLADMQAIATAIETYTIDHNRTPTVLTGYPGSRLNGPSLVNPALTGIAYVSYRFRRLTTPISYLSSVFPDVFVKNGIAKLPGGTISKNYDSFDYVDSKVHPDLKIDESDWKLGGITSGGSWRISSTGPDIIQGFGGSTVGTPGNENGVTYDATNGTISRGDIVRVGGVAPIKAGFLPGVNRVTGQINDPKMK